jgi:dihydrofolate reductase
MGARTYEHALELSKSYGWAYGDKPTFVITNNKWVSDKNNIQFYRGDLKTLVNEQLKPRFKNVWLVGGASLAKDFIQLQLADQLRISILPIILGEGKPFFQQLKQEILLHLTDITAYKNGMVELCYEIKK